MLKKQRVIKLKPTEAENNTRLSKMQARTLVKRVKEYQEAKQALAEAKEEFQLVKEALTGFVDKHGDKTKPGTDEKTVMHDQYQICLKHVRGRTSIDEEAAIEWAKASGWADKVPGLIVFCEYFDTEVWDDEVIPALIDAEEWGAIDTIENRKPPSYQLRVQEVKQ